jgi:non-specific serine/threonine protein kinase
MLQALDHLNAALTGRYSVEREVGAGGMAVVYLAEDLKHHRRVAIKVLKPELAATIGADRFLREIEIAARLNHPHILPLFDSGAAGDLLYYVMPFVTGESLRSLLDRQRQLSVDDALRLAREIASGIGYAHQQGIVHRDIKPANILLTDGIALVADFGIARALRGARSAGETDARHTLTVTGLALGTPAYMSPEQLIAAEVDGRADLYSLGCVLFEMLTGQPPFVGPTLEALVRAHLTTAPRSVSELRPTVPPGVAAVIARALAKDPAERYASAALFAEAIATAAGVAITSPRPGDDIDVPNNLPRQRTRFIGRERELAECARLLGDTRLLTLTGIGGSGKTRLALRLAESLLPSHPDGVWFVDLAPLTDAGRVAAAVASALGVREAADQTLLEVIAGHVRDKRTLIVLDNCEHLLAPAGDIANALLGGHDVRVLVTSREGLGLDGERLLPVRSMTVPAADSARDVHAVEDAEAVKLFVDRAQLARADFALDPTNAAAVAEICRRLDGIPLAIELAAARVKVLSVEQIRVRLDDRFRLLTGGSKSVPRQQTLRAAIQWSYDQLTPEEQRLLRRLSVFAGGWTLESATAVAGADEFAVLDLLAHLVDKSLVLVEQTSGSEARYGLLETVRQYAHERLLEAGEADDARQAHLRFVCELAERAYTERFVREEAWSQRLETEHDNLRAALTFVRDQDSERYLELVGAIAFFWWGRSHYLEGREHVTAALAAASADPPRRSQARALWGLARIVSFQGDVPTARKAMEDSLAIWRAVGDRRETTAALEGLGWAQLISGDDEQAYRTFEECLRLQRELGDPLLAHRAMIAIAQTLVVLSRVDEARPMSMEIITFARSINDKRGEHAGCHYLADCALIEGNCTESLGLYRQSLVLAQAVGDRMATCFEMDGVAMSLAGLGESERAVRLVAASREEWKRIGMDVHLRFWDRLIDRYIGPARTSLGTGAQAAWDAGTRLTLDQAAADALDAAADARRERPSATGRGVGGIL